MMIVCRSGLDYRYSNIRKANFELNQAQVVRNLGDVADIEAIRTC